MAGMPPDMAGMPLNRNITTGTGVSTMTGIPVLTLARTAASIGIRGMAGMPARIMVHTKKPIMIGTRVHITIGMVISAGIFVSLPLDKLSKLSLQKHHDDIGRTKAETEAFNARLSMRPLFPKQQTLSAARTLDAPLDGHCTTRSAPN